MGGDSSVEVPASKVETEILGRSAGTSNDGGIHRCNAVDSLIRQGVIIEEILALALTGYSDVCRLSWEALPSRQR
jgi:hypothetical protein